MISLRPLGVSTLSTMLLQRWASGTFSLAAVLAENNSLIEADCFLRIGQLQPAQRETYHFRVEPKGGQVFISTWSLQRWSAQ